MVHVQYIHDQDYIQRRRTIHPFQNNRWLGLSSNKKTALVDKTVLKATLLCVWKGELYRIYNNGILFYIRFYFIVVATADVVLLCFATLLLYRTRLQWLLLLCNVQDCRCYFPCTCTYYCCFVASLSVLLLSLLLLCCCCWTVLILRCCCCNCTNIALLLL